MCTRLPGFRYFLLVSVVQPYFSVGLAPSRVPQLKENLVPVESLQPPVAELSLEDLAYKYHTDKSKDDHAYVNLYNMILEPIRHQVHNVTEVGVATGQSLQMWHDYFSEAHIWGLDIENVSLLNDVMAPYSDRVHMFQADSQVSGTASTIGLAPESMDLVIDDGDHRWIGQEKTLNYMFHLVKPGGYYVIEDVEWDHEDTSSVSYRIEHHPEWLHPNTQAILANNNAFFADTTLGHRAFKEYSHIIGSFFAADRFRHNSHMVIIQKRKEPLHPVQINMLNGYMKWDSNTNWGRWKFIQKMEGWQGLKDMLAWNKPADQNKEMVKVRIGEGMKDQKDHAVGSTTAVVDSSGAATVAGPST